MQPTRAIASIAAIVLLVAACGDDDTGSATSAAPTTTATTSAEVTSTTAAATTTTTAAATTTSAAPTTTEAATTTEPPMPTAAITIDGSNVTIDWSLVAAPFFAPPAAGSDDPFYHLHTNPATDGFFLAIEAYTVYGEGWTGELGTFDIDCAPEGTGICVHFDPDGPGPEGNAGADGLATGRITFHELSDNGFRATLEDVRFSNGLTIAGPLEVTG